MSILANSGWANQIPVWCYFVFLGLAFIGYVSTAILYLLASRKVDKATSKKSTKWFHVRISCLMIALAALMLFIPISIAIEGDWLTSKVCCIISGTIMILLTYFFDSGRVKLKKDLQEELKKKEDHD